MKKTLYILLAAVAVISCTKAQTTVSPEQEIFEPQGKIVSFTVTAIKDESTKATLNTTDRCIEWEDGDINDAKLFNAAFTNEGGVTPSRFEISGDRKSVTITYTDVELKQGYQTASDTFWFVFGAEGEILNGGKESESINYVLPTTVSGAKAQPVMVGVCETTDHNSLSFNLQLAAAYAKIGIKPDEPSASLLKAEIFGADATTYIAGTCNFAKNGTITPVSSGSTDYCHISATNLDGAKEFYVNLNPRNNSTTTTNLTLLLFNPSGQAMIRDLNATTLAHPINLTSSSYHEFIYGSFKPITITSTINATTTYSQYTAGQVTLANNTDNTYKIWDITANKTVTGIPASASRLESFIQPKFLCDEVELDGNYAEKLSQGPHTLDATFAFVYNGQSISLPSTVTQTIAHITGLPLAATRPTKETWTDYRNIDNWAYPTTDGTGVIYNENAYISRTFYIPSNINVTISHDGKVRRGSTLVTPATTYTVEVSGNTVYTITASKNQEYSTKTSFTAIFSSSNPSIKCSNTSRYAFSTYAFTFSVGILYRQN